MYSNIMYINQIDELFDSILNKLNDYLDNHKAFTKLSLDTNFVKFQNDILNYIKNFIETIPKKDITNIIKKDTYYEIILNIIKRYCAFYIYLGIGYYYEGGRDLFITNMIETSRYQKDSKIQIPNFFNSENNFKIISFYTDIKNFISLIQLKTIDKIKIILSNNPQRYETTISLFNDLGEDYILEYFLIKDNFHNMLKAIIFKQIYLKEEKNEIVNILNQQEKSDVEYKFIEIVISNQKKLVDFNVIQKFLSISELKSGLAEEIYNYLEENRDNKELIIKENEDYINYLFSNKIIIPITEDFLRYHKDTEKYDPESLVENSNIKERDATKIKYIISKMNNVKNYHSLLLDNNPKLKLETEKLFFKPLQPKLAVLFNDNEEIKIIQKLEISENATDYDLLIDLLNIRKYSYVNFKKMSKDGIKIRPEKTIQGIRQTSLLQKDNVPIETRIGHDNIDMNVIGIAFNPSKKSLDCFNKNNFINVKNKNESNGFKQFINILNETFDTKDNKLYYWLFDSKTDKSTSKTYVNYTNNIQNNIKLMIFEIYNIYINLVTNKLKKYLKSIESITIWDIYNIFKAYEKNYFDFKLNPSIKNELIEYALIKKVPEIEIVPDEIESIIPGKNESIIELPILKIIKEKKNIIKIGDNDIDIKIFDSKKYNPICHHYIKWRNIRYIKNIDNYNQAIFDFVKQYVSLNDKGEYFCKGCQEAVKMEKFEATYDQELDTFLITSISVGERLEDIPKYSKYMRTIRNLEKNIEKFAYSMDIISLLGNSPDARIRRKSIIKDVIDIILVHTEWLREQPKNRIELYNQKYGIGKDLTNLFFFELKDEIFLTSSTDTDQYKIIKYNNIMAYLIVVILTELNFGQLINLREDKRINYFFYKKIGSTLFSNLFLRVNQKQKVSLTNIPLLAYIIYYLSGIMVSNRLWLYNDKNIDVKDKPVYLINTQKIIINTVIDLLNTLFEANTLDEKNFIYEIINTRISIKINNIYNDEQLLKRVETRSLKNIKFDENTKKVSFLNKKINFIELNIDYKDIENKIQLCSLKTYELNKLKNKTDNNSIDGLTNCSDGKFHKWIFMKKNNDLICEICNKSYNEEFKNLTTTSSENNTFDYLDKLKYINLNKLSKKYCLSGETHDIDNYGICSKCKVDINKFEVTIKELKQLDKNIDIKSNELILNQINLINEIKKKNIKINENIKEIISNFNKEYDKIKDLKLENYINSFVDKLIKILGNKIKVNDKIIYLKETVYIIDHDYLGNPMKNPINILSSDNKIQYAYKHASFNKDVIYYKDKSNNVYVYYDSITMQYLGYSEDNKNIKKNKNNPSIQIELSIKDSIIYLGYENQYYNIYHINKDFQDNLPSELNKEYILKIIRNRINDLKQIIMRTNSIINNIRNSGKILSNYNINEKEIVNEFTKKLKKFNISNGKDEIFKNFKEILSNIHINYKIPDNFKINLNKNYIDINIINTLNNSDIKLIFYLIDNLNKLLDYNTQPAIESELAHLIIKIIKFLFNMYYRPYFNYNIRKFDYLLLNETVYIDETLRVVGHFQELLTQNEIDDPDKKEEEYSLKEASDAFDIDDYGDDEDKKYDDIDNSIEALDGYE